MRFRNTKSYLRRRQGSGAAELGDESAANSTMRIGTKSCALGVKAKLERPAHTRTPGSAGLAGPGPKGRSGWALAHTSLRLTLLQEREGRRISQYPFAQKRTYT